MQRSDAAAWVKIPRLRLQQDCCIRSQREQHDLLSSVLEAAGGFTTRPKVMGETRSQASLHRKMLRSEKRFARTSRSRSDLSDGSSGAHARIPGSATRSPSHSLSILVLESLSKFLKFAALRAPGSHPAEDLLKIHEVQASRRDELILLVATHVLQQANNASEDPSVLLTPSG